MHLVEISIFSLNLVIIRLTRIVNRAEKIRHNFRKKSTLKIKTFKKKYLNKSWSPSNYSSQNFFSETLDQFLTQKNDFESTNFDMFEEVVHNFGKSYDDMIW